MKKFEDLTGLCTGRIKVTCPPKLVKKKKPVKKEIWQNHHTCYDPERTVRVRRSEHFYLTKLSRFSGFSLGMDLALIQLIADKPRVHESTHEKKM